MSAWHDVSQEAPELAAFVRARIDTHGLALLATLRRDGAPRISGIEPLFADGELWLGMMPGSLKALDLQRDARFALHNATVDKQVTEGDVKIAGAAVEVGDEAKTAFVEAFAAATGAPPPPGPFTLFRADVTEIVSIRPDVEHLVIESWHAGRGLTRFERR